MTEKQTTTRKRIYVPYMCDHGYALAAALRAHNLPAEVIEPTTSDTLALGLHYCIGRECLPCLTTTGDILKRTRQPDFDPEQAMIFMPTTGGSCRFGHYNVLHQTILREEGMGAVEFMSPTADNSYHGLGDRPTQLRLLIWQGAVAVDLLTRLLHQYRPYELHAGQTDQLYRRALDRIIAAIEAGGGKKLVETMKWVAQQFEAHPVDTSVQRPLIGIVGEIYIRMNFHVNQDIARQVEAVGGEAHFASIIEWIYYTNWTYKNDTRSIEKAGEHIKAVVSDLYQRYLEHNLLKPVEHLLHHPHETHTSILMDNLKPYYHPSLASEAVLSIGAAIDFGKRNFDGIINIMPFACMPGVITAGMAPRIRADLDNIPWLDISYDAQGSTNIKTRLEAFLYQATQFKRRKAAVAHA
jgi:predicted nucleotide-binding protein (sugar kinase/HSP70/actin superfamily)